MPLRVVCRFCKDQFGKRADDPRELCLHCYDLIGKMIHDAIVGTDRDTFAFTDEYLAKRLGQMALEIKKENIARLQETDLKIDDIAQKVGAEALGMIHGMNERIINLGQDYVKYQTRINKTIGAMKLQKNSEKNTVKEVKKRGRPAGSKNKTKKDKKHKTHKKAK